MTAPPHLHALAMRTAAAEACANVRRFRTDRGDEVGYDNIATGAQDCRELILALPLEADHAALLAEAVKVLRDDIAAQHKRVMSGEQRFYAKNITNACSEMGGPLGNAVERLIAALSALETP